MECEICVLGGGPAGSTAAHKLALLEHDVLLIERFPFPRPHVGESLPPGVLPLLEALGVQRSVLGAGFLRPEATTVRWGGTTSRLKHRPSERALLVDRGRFDHVLLRSAGDSGVRVMQPATARRPRYDAGRWRIPVDCAAGTVEVRARFLVDATGRRHLLPGRQKRCSPPMLAIYGYWRESGMSREQTWVEAGQNHWFWGAPLPDGTFNATVFVGPNFRPVAKLGGIEALYRALLARSSFLAQCLRGVLSGHVEVCDASSRLDIQPVSEHMIKVGEASFCLDPLSSQGVQAAIQSGIQGSIAAHTILTRPESASMAVQFYRNRQIETVARHTRVAASHYREQFSSSGQVFWQERSLAGAGAVPKQVADYRNDAPLSPSQLLTLCGSVTIADLPGIEGSVIRNVKGILHPHLEIPLVYLNDAAIAPLLQSIDFPATPREIIARWAPRIATEKSWGILQWMWGKGILVPTVP